MAQSSLLPSLQSHPPAEACADTSRLGVSLSTFKRTSSAPEPGDRREGEAGATRLSQLNPTLMQDLLRFDSECKPGQGIDLLQVMAAALRHGRNLRVHLQLGDRVLTLTVLPTEHHVQTPMRLTQWTALRLSALTVLRVEPAPRRGGEPADGTDTADAADASDPDAETTPGALSAAPVAAHEESLGPLLWELALHGARKTLLPEIAGVAAYRVTPSADLSGLNLQGPTKRVVQGLREQMTPFADLARRPGFDRERACRVLNGLYLQSALMVSRSHPGAIGR
jgi:hypothetical protein